LAVRSEEDLFDEAAEDYEEEDPALAEGHWEGQSIGTGRRRQGNSSEVDRHADPRVELEEKALGRIYLDADDEAEVKAERRERTKKPPKAGRADGSSMAPGGVPKADHVTNSTEAPPPE